MGYYTSFSLTLHCDSDKKKAIEEAIEEQSGVIFDGDSAYIKWYDYEEDMRKVSEEFPDVLMELYGEGEESGDMWHARFLNGKSELVEAETIWPEFKEILTEKEKSSPAKKESSRKIFNVIVDDCNGGSSSVSVESYDKKEDAEKAFRDLVDADRGEAEKVGWKTEESKDSYESYEDGYECQNHYSVRIQETELH